jgi:protein-tyrosine-phosphatase
MEDPDLTETPQKKGILFACNMNSIRSPMAEALARHVLGNRVPVCSVGIYEGYKDPFIDAVLAEDGLEAPEHDSQDFSAIDPEDYELLIALTPQAAKEGGKLFREEQIEFWDIPNPTDELGGREELIKAYRHAYSVLKARINARFS